MSDASPRSRTSLAVVVHRLTVPLVLASMALVLGVGLGGETPPSAFGAAETARLHTVKASVPSVDVFPIPGGRAAAPSTQITFRGLPANSLGPITVTGSRSGVHTGHVQGDSDGNGGSFLPDHPFTAGEKVTVATRLNIVSGSRGSFSFQIAQPTTPLPILHWPAASHGSHSVQFFHSRHDLSPVSVTVTKHGATGDGDIFVAPQWGPAQDGPMILDPNGNLVWFDRLSGNTSAASFTAQRYQGKPVLTWWEGTMAAGVSASGQDVIFDNTYREIETVKAGNGLTTDLHAFVITPQNTALITADYPVYVNASSVKGGRKKQIVIDSVVQEIDIKTGLVLFQWDSLDHIPLTDTHNTLPSSAGSPFDAYHLNSVAIDHDNNLIISSRETWGIYKVNRRSGAIIWTLGGRHSSFRLGSGTYWAYQHDAEPRSSNDTQFSFFDNEGGPPLVRNQSRAVHVTLDFKHHTARSVSVQEHSPALASNYEGDVQQLGDGEFVGWGQQPYFTQYDSKGNMVFDAHMNSDTASYRANRFGWHATPWNAPAVAASTSKGHSFVFMSWNGATDVAGWRVYAGSSPSSLHYVMSVSKSGFEARAEIPPNQYVQVQALDSSHHVLRSSSVVATH